jgi:hypothetical protein
MHPVVYDVSYREGCLYDRKRFSPVDDDPDFLGQVVLSGDGRSALPDMAIEFPLTRKLELPVSTARHKDAWKLRFDAMADDAQLVREAQMAEDLEKLNESVGGWLSLRYIPGDNATPEQEAIKAAAVPSLADCLATPHVEASLELGWSGLGRTVIEKNRLGIPRTVPLSK